jgi:hypothetical protein
MAAYSRRALLANSFGTFGYFSCLLLWVWVAVLYLPAALGNEQVKEFLLPAEGHPVSAPESLAPSPGVIIFAIIITVVIMAVTLFVLLRAPVTIARTGKAVTTRAAGSIEPLVVHGRTLPLAEKRRLAASLIKFVKLLLVLIPVAAGLLTALLLPPTLPYEMVMLVTGVLGLASVLWFSAQYILADILGVKPEKLV